jgi:hypothetical protein
VVWGEGGAARRSRAGGHRSRLEVARAARAARVVTVARVVRAARLARAAKVARAAGGVGMGVVVGVGVGMRVRSTATGGKVKRAIMAARAARAGQKTIRARKRHRA